MRHSKPSLATALLALLPVTSAVSRSTSQCIRTQAHDLASRAPCPDASALSACLHNLGEYFPQSAVEACHLGAGCSADEASVSATALIYYCEDSAVAAAANNRADLRKRQRQAGGSGSGSSDDNDDKPSNQEEEGEEGEEEKETPEAKPAPAAAPKETQAPEPARETPAPENTPPPKQVTALAQTTEASQDASRRTGTACFVTSTETINVCSVVNGDSTCTDTPVEKVRCLSGWLCRSDRQGNSTCMTKIDKLDTGGIIVALIFAGAIVVSFGLMIFFCCRDRSTQRKLAAKADAAAIAKESGVGKKARSASQRQPLMAEQHAQQHQVPGGQQQGVSSGYGAPPPAGQQDPFTDQSRY